MSQLNNSWTEEECLIAMQQGLCPDGWRFTVQDYCERITAAYARF